MDGWGDLVYTITCDGHALFDPRLDGLTLGSPVLSQEANKFSTLTFDIYRRNTSFGYISLFQSLVKVYRDGTLICITQPRHLTHTFHGGFTFSCDDLLARLDYVNVIPNTGGRGIGTFLNAMFRVVNDRYQDVTLAVGTISSSFTEEPFDWHVSEYVTAWEAIQDHLLNVIDGYLVPHYTDNVITVDFLSEDDLPLSSQSLTITTNIVDLQAENDTEDLFTVLIPLGKKGVTESKKSKYTDGRALNISSVNDGSVYLVNAQAVALYGWIERVETFKNDDDSEIEDAQVLLEKGQEYMEEHVATNPETLTLSAVDLHNAKADIAALRYLTRVPVYSSMHSIDRNYVIRRMDIPLGVPAAGSIDVGAPKRSLTERLNSNDVDVWRSLMALDRQ